MFIVEVILRAYSSDDYFVWHPNLEKTFKPLPGIMPGISGESRFTINASGMRGDPFPEGDRYRILTIGGSTTECLYLDQSEAWPQLLQDKLNNLGGPDVWVGNVGASGRNTRHHLLQIEKLLEQYPRIELIVLLIGINDLSLRLRQDIDFRPMRQEGPEYKQILLNKAFSVHPTRDPLLPFYKRTEIWRLLRRVKHRVLIPVANTVIQDDAAEIYKEWRRHRRNAAKVLDTLPDLSSALEEYAQNIHSIIDLAQERGTAIVFMTQPSMWRQDLPESLSNLLWFGGIGNFQEQSGKPYYSVNALANAMEMYNETLLNVCKIRPVDCLDLAPLVPKDTTAFYDDVHFNEQGATTVANALAQFVVEKKIIGGLQ